jgi:DNA polymerase III delta prime subunit
MKFVILDEVDYMTKNAQQALKSLIQNYSSSVRFCLICNYISRIDEGLQNEFIKLRFNQLPENDIIFFLKQIAHKENLLLEENSIYLLQKLYKSDIRSMINFMQSNQCISNNQFNIIQTDIWELLFFKLSSSLPLEEIELFINNTSIKYNINKKNLIKDFCNYIIRNKTEIISPEFLNFVENIMHFEDCKQSYFIKYTLLSLFQFIPKSEL